MTPPLVQHLPLAPSQLGESPFWHLTENRLYWCDIEGFCVNAWCPETQQSQRWPMPSEPACCAPALSGGLVIGLRDGFYFLNTRTAALQCLALLPPPHDTRRLRLNDGRCDSHGRFWAGSVVTPRTHPDAALWRLQATPHAGDTDGRSAYAVQCMAGDNFTANGLAFSPDNAWMYWSNTPEHRIDRFAFDAATGTVSHRQPWAHFARKQEGTPYGGRPDGAAVDVQGNYWVALYEGACVLQLSPTGQVLQRVPVPVQCPTMVCLGGADLRTMYITSARAGRPQAEHDALVPAGALMSLRVEVPGLPVNFFRMSAG